MQVVKIKLSPQLVGLQAHPFRISLVDLRQIAKRNLIHNLPHFLIQRSKGFTARDTSCSWCSETKAAAQIRWADSSSQQQKIGVMQKRLVGVIECAPDVFSANQLFGTLS